MWGWHTPCNTSKPERRDKLKIKKRRREDLTQCARCFGKGNLPHHANVDGGICFRCNGSGWVVRADRKPCDSIHCGNLGHYEYQDATYCKPCLSEAVG